MTNSDVINDIAIIHENGVILEVGKFSDLKENFDGRIEPLGDALIVPGLVNAHIHLELSHLKNKTVQGEGFFNWIVSLLANPMYELVEDKVVADVKNMKNSGTAYVADISTANCKKIATILDSLDIGFTAFCESIGTKPLKENSKFFPKVDFHNGRISGAAHAPYSCSTELLQKVHQACESAGLPFSIHLSENKEEDEIVRFGTGEFAKRLENSNMLADCGTKDISPVKYAYESGILSPSTLAVHCVTVSDEDIKLLERTNTNVCLCPRSNKYIGEGKPPIEKFLNSSVNVCLGTDSIASNYDLNMFNELKFLLNEINYKISPFEALKTVTTNSAKALKIEKQYGTIEKGKKASFAIVPDSLKDFILQ